MIRSRDKVSKSIIDDTIKYITESINDKKKVLIFYHSDADGLMSLWLITRLCKKIGASCIRSIPVWNHDFTFEFLESITTNSFVIFTDLPVLQEHARLADFCADKHCFVYDHHRPPKNLPTLIPNVEYQNSLIFSTESYPASYFACLLHKKIFGESDLCNLLTSIGLIGDHALNNFNDIKRSTQNRYPGIFDGDSLWVSTAGKLCSAFNVIFKANPLGLNVDLSEYIPKSEDDPLNELLEIVTNLGTSEMSKAVTKEVNYYYTLYTKSDIKDKYGSNLIDLTNMSTFSVGIVAARLISDDIYTFVALGFKLGNKIQYELRVDENENFSVLDVLDNIKTEYLPISCGGHKYAGGLLVKSDDREKVEQLMIMALTQY